MDNKENAREFPLISEGEFPCECEKGSCPHERLLFKRITGEGYFLTVWARPGVPTVGVHWGRLTGDGLAIEWEHNFGMGPDAAMTFSTAIFDGVLISDGGE